jgi:hypothetical protein
MSGWDRHLEIGFWNLANEIAAPDKSGLVMTKKKVLRVASGQLLEINACAGIIEIDKKIYSSSSIFA